MIQAATLHTKQSLAAAEAAKNANAKGWMSIHEEAYGKGAGKSSLQVEIEVQTVSLTAQ